MKKIKFKIASWDEGRKFIKEIAKELNAKVEIRDDKQIITTDSIEIRFHPDDRGFSFITCKLHDVSLEETIRKYEMCYGKK